MKNFKKFLSAALSVALIAVTAVGGIGATAETSDNEGSESTAIKATPVSDWLTSNAYWKWCQKTEITPLSFVNAKGLRVNYRKYDSDSPDYLDYSVTEFYCRKGYLGYDFYKMDNDGKITETYYNSIADTEGLIFYVKTESANYILPKLELINETNQGEYHLKKGSNYYYAAIGSSTWQTGTALAGSSDESYGFKGVISFEGAFEGYVKIPYSSMGNDGSRVMNTETDKTKAIGFNIAKLGGDYGTVSIGPVMLITEDSTSTKIEVPEKWQISDLVVKPLSEYASMSSAKLTGTKASISSGTLTGNGVKISSSNYYYCDCSTVASNDSSQNMNKAPSYKTSYASEQKLDNASGFIFYVKTDVANQISAQFNIPDYGWDCAYLGTGKAYYLMSVNGISWETKTASRGNNGELAYGLIDLTAGFEGYVKIPFSSIYNSRYPDDATAFGTINSETAKNYKLTAVEWRSRKIGTDTDGTEYSYTVGPVYLVMNDSSSSEIKVEYDPINAKAVTRYEMKHFQTDVNDSVTDIAVLGLKGAKLTLKEGKSNITSTDGFIKSKAYIQMQLKNATDKYEIGEDGSGAYNGKHFELPANAKTNGAILVYVKIPAKNKMQLALKTKYSNASYFGTSGLKKDAVYYTWQTGEAGWQLHTSTESIADDGDKGLIEFDGAFEGYVKIPAGSIEWKGSAIIGRVEAKFEGLGGDYGDEIIVSPLMYTEQDSLSTTVNVTKAFEDGDVDRSGAIDSADLAACRKFLLGADVDANAGDADANYDGKADILDLIRIKKILVSKAG